MRKSAARLGFFLVFTAVALASVGVPAAEPYTEERESGPRRHLLRRASQATPQEQLAYADGLKARGQFKKADRQYRWLVRSWPNAPEAAVAQLNHAVHLRKRKKFEKSFEALQHLVETYPGRFPFDEVLSMQFGIAKDLMERRRGQFLFFPGFRSPQQALPLLEKVVKNGPRWEHAAEAQYLMGQIREENREEEMAVLDYMDTMLRYPRSPYATKAALGRARGLVHLSNRSPYDRELAQEAWYALTMYRTSYLGSQDPGEVDEMTRTVYNRLARGAYDIALFYDLKAKRPKSALVAYESFVRSYPVSEWTEEANARIEDLSKVVNREEHAQFAQ